MITKILPIAQIIIAVGSSIVYFSQKDIRHGIYWAGAAVITASVTF